jgi:predicted nucleic acid-binding protein
VSGASYLLDTNVLSETRRKQPDARVVNFLSSHQPEMFFFSVLALGELRKGVAMKARTDALAASLLSEWVDGLEFSFADRIVGIDSAAARFWGEWSAERSRPVVDTLIAATAFSRGLTLATRNTSDVQGLPVAVVNPWLA